MTLPEGPTASARRGRFATTILMMPKISCRGVLLVHDDGGVLFCTAQGRGRCSGALAPAWHKKVASCRSLYATSHCRHCAEHGASARWAQVSDVA